MTDFLEMREVSKSFPGLMNGIAAVSLRKSRLESGIMPSPFIFSLICLDYGREPRVYELTLRDSNREFSESEIYTALAF